MGVVVIACGQKGGSGKTFLVRHLGVEFTLRGFRVIILDCDPQGTALTWAELAVAHNTLAPPVIGVGEELEAAIARYSAQTDILLVDTQGALNDRLSDALLASDLALLPVNPCRPEDVWGLADSLAVVTDLQGPELRPDLQARIVITGRRKTKICASSIKAIEKKAYPTFRTILPERNEYNMATALGRGITTYKPKSQAAEEFRALTDEVLALLPGLKQPATQKKEAGHVA